MNFEEYQECRALLDAWYECLESGNQGTFARAQYAAKELMKDLNADTKSEVAEKMFLWEVQVRYNDGLGKKIKKLDDLVNGNSYEFAFSVATKKANLWAEEQEMITNVIEVKIHQVG